jgi:hypothetical protein
VEHLEKVWQWNINQRVKPLKNIFLSRISHFKPNKILYNTLQLRLTFTASEWVASVTAALGTKSFNNYQNVLLIQTISWSTLTKLLEYVVAAVKFRHLISFFNWITQLLQTIISHIIWLLSKYFINFKTTWNIRILYYIFYNDNNLFVQLWKLQRWTRTWVWQG